jgi:hypothetical protein
VARTYASYLTEEVVQLWSREGIPAERSEVLGDDLASEGSTRHGEAREYRRH